jgi:hypothetical protein
MEIIKYKNKYKQEWDSFIDKSKNGTLFHTRRFINYHPVDRFEDSSLIFKKKNWVSVIPATIQNIEGEIVFKSHPGASYGGPIFNNSTGLRTTLDVVESLINYATDEGFSAIEMRLPPRVFHVHPSEDIDYALWYLGFEVVSTELSSAVRIEDSDNFRSDTARSIVKARKSGIIVKDSSDWDYYWKILNQNLTKYRTKSTHTLQEIKKLLKLCGDSIKLKGAYLDDQLIAGTVVFWCNGVAAHTFYIAQDYDYQKLRPLNLIFAELINELRDSGYRYLNFGISTESAGRAINDGLFRFKEGFGARGVVRRYYRKELV